MVGTGGAPHATQWAPAIMDRETPHLARHPASSTTSQRWSSTLAEALPMEQIREASSHTHTPTRANPRGAHPGAHPCSTQVCHMPSDTSAHVWHSKMAPRDERDKGNEVWGAGHGVQGHCHGVVCKGCGSGLVCCLLIQLSYYTSMMVLHIDQDLFFAGDTQTPEQEVKKNQQLGSPSRSSFVRASAASTSQARSGTWWVMAHHETMTCTQGMMHTQASPHIAGASSKPKAQNIGTASQAHVHC